jgi:hypothetical protein
MKFEFTTKFCAFLYFIENIENFYRSFEHNGKDSKEEKCRQKKEPKKHHFYEPETELTIFSITSGPSFS